MIECDSALLRVNASVFGGYHTWQRVDDSENGDIRFQCQFTSRTLTMPVEGKKAGLLVLQFVENGPHVFEINEADIVTVKRKAEKYHGRPLRFYDIDCETSSGAGKKDKKWKLLFVNVGSPNEECIEIAI